MYSSTVSLTSALVADGWPSSLPAALPRERDPVPIVQEAVWASWSVWTVAENLTPIGIRFPDRPARIESLYRLRYPSLLYLRIEQVKL